MLLPSTILLKALHKDKILENSNDDKSDNSNNLTNDSNDTNSSDSTKVSNNSDDTNSANNNENAAEIRKLLRRKDELLRKQRMQEKYNERLQVCCY